MARHGRRPPPAPAARPVGFSPATNHTTCFPPVLRRLQREQLEARPTGFSRITNHETRNTAFFRNTAFIAVGARGVAPPETSVRPTAPAGKSLFSCSRLFTIVRHCSAKNIVSEPVSVPAALAVAAATPHRPAAAFLRVVVRHRAAMARHGRRPTPAPATRPVGFHQPRDTKHGFSLSLRRLQGEQPQARPTGFSRITRHETRITAFMPFFPRFPGISRYSSAPPPPGIGVRAPSAAAGALPAAEPRKAVHIRPTAYPHL